MMDDYISRQAAIEKIHSEFDECLVWDESGKHTADEVERILDTIQPADVRPVVLCKDCDLWNSWDSSGKESLGNYRCSCAEWTTESNKYYTGPNEYCSRGERKDSDG